MTVTAMVNPSYRGLRLWQDEWLRTNGPQVEQHQRAQNVTRMRNGDVFVWVCDPQRLLGLEFDKCETSTLGAGNMHREMAELREILRSRMR